MTIPKPVYDLLITSPAEFVDRSIIEEFKKWNGEASSSDILFTLDKITYHGLASPFIIEVLELLFSNAIAEENITEEEAMENRTWDGPDFKRG